MHCSPYNAVQPARLAALALSACLAGCSVTVDTLGIIGNDPKLYRGASTGYSDMTGTIKMATADGSNRCTGDFQYVTMKAGYGSLTCSDGRSAQIQFTALNMTTGYGTGFTSDGQTVSFVYGMKDAEAAQYLRNAQVAGRLEGAAGAGFFINAQGDLLTTADVVHGCMSAITLRTPAGDTMTANIVALDTDLDLAALHASRGPATLPHWATGASQAGDPVIAYRFPPAGQLSGDSDAVVTGKLTALNRANSNPSHLQMTTPAQAADNGGPLVDASGQVVGVVSGWLSDKQGWATTDAGAQAVNFAIKGDIAKTFLNNHGIDIATPESAGDTVSVADMGAILQGYVVQLSCQTAS